MISSEHALLIIDMQQGLFHGPVSPYQADALLANVCLLIEKARQAEREESRRSSGFILPGSPPSNGSFEQ